MNAETMEAAKEMNEEAAADRYSITGELLTHELRIGAVHLRATMPTNPNPPLNDPKGAWWSGYLSGTKTTATRQLRKTLRTADLFCGPGGLANGVQQLCRELGVSVVSEFILDQDVEAVRVYAANHQSRTRSTDSASRLTDYAIQHNHAGARFAYPPEVLDVRLEQCVGQLDLVLAGPPCQGHSNLNNRTRRSDPRNDLYLTVPAFAVAVGAPVCIIENVPSIVNDYDGVVRTSTQLFDSEGYHVTTGTLIASDLGWPQTRKRHFLVARRDTPPIELTEVAALLRDEPRSIWWAIGALEDDVGQDPMRQVTEISEDNQARIDWLFDNDEYDLALDERPNSHRDGTSYTAVYGRLRKERPAPTITTGFMSPGRGRYTHPTRRRVLTPREAARLQGFPDSYQFIINPRKPPSRSQLAKWIGDAVPMPLGYAAALAGLGSGLPRHGHRSVRGCEAIR